MAKTAGGGRKRCTLGKSCGATCIAANETCWVDLPQNLQTPVTKLRDFIQKRGPGIAEHGAKGVIAWKAGRIIGPAVSGYLENHYGIPREVSGRLAETVVQGVTATALEAKHLRSADAFLKKLLTETAAAYAGKAAHAGAEHALAGEEIKPLLQQAAPILAGKFTGIATAIVGGKTPTPAALAGAIAGRAKEDTLKLINMVRPQTVGFAEENYDDIATLLADVAVAALMLEG